MKTVEQIGEEVELERQERDLLALGWRKTPDGLRHASGILLSDVEIMRAGSMWEVGSIMARVGDTWNDARLE